MGFTKYTTAKEKERLRINDAIRAKELRIVGPEGENFGIMSSDEALAKAQEMKLDLIEVSANATPPVARIADLGKYKYELKKKAKEVKAKAHVTETKTTQVKIGTGERDMHLKASQAAGWLREGHRVKVDLFLWGRYKYMEFNFLKGRLERFLAIIPESFKIADDIKKGPKGLSVVIERDKSGKRWVPSAPKGPGIDTPPSEEEMGEEPTAEASEETYEDK
ncbi:translation initiation factor IF-3 [Candidatus Kaiserbacteria bacterium]|nr:translation initiation factor IF-3 [Candidatus Kaiserbacteria bacterium]